MDELAFILAETKARLKIKLDMLSESSFNLWFGEMELDKLDDRSARFTTPSPVKHQFLATKYKGYIKDALEEVIGFPLDVEIVYTANLEKVRAKEEEEKERLRKEEEEKKRKEALSEEDDEDKITEYINGKSQKVSTLESYTFDNFVEGSSNKFARAACYAVANEPTAYNPLFIYGNSGLGKTHLLFAIINHMRKTQPDLKIVYKKCESFLDELVKSIKDGSTAPFKEKYRSADVLLIDDVQFLAGKEQTQEEFFHTFSALYESDKQIILTSDRPPKEIKPLEDRLRTRFEGGLLADVQPPSFELRTAIIRKKSDDMGILISNDMVNYMAERLHNNIRQIEGVLKRIYAVSSFTSSEVTREYIDEAISIIDPGNIPTVTLIEKIINAVSRFYDIPIESMKSKKRTNNIVNARHVAIYVIKTLTDLSQKEIGSIFGRDHSTVINSLETVDRNMRTINNYKENIDKIIKEVKG